MRNLLDLKEVTIEELRSRLNKIGVAGEDAVAKKAKSQGTFIGENYRENMALMTKALREREDQIEELQEKVAQATRCVFTEHINLIKNICIYCSFLMLMIVMLCYCLC